MRRVASALVVVLLLAACGDSDEAASTTTVPPVASGQNSPTIELSKPMLDVRRNRAGARSP